MKTFTLSDKLANILEGLSGPTPIRDRSETVVGVVTPAVVKTNVNGEQGWTEADLAEAERALASPTRGYTLKEAWEHIYAAHDNLIAILMALNEPTELRGSSGQVVAVFTPGERQ